MLVLVVLIGIMSISSASKRDRSGQAPPKESHHTSGCPVSCLEFRAVWGVMVSCVGARIHSLRGLERGSSGFYTGSLDWSGCRFLERGSEHLHPIMPKP